MSQQVGAVEGRLLNVLERAQIPVLSLCKHGKLLKSLFAEQQLADVLHGLSAKGSLLSVERGVYVVLPRAALGSWHEDSLVIAAALAPEPAYVSYWAALAHHGLTTQLPRTVTMALRDHRKAPLSFQGRRYEFVRQASARFYGYAPVELTALNGAATVTVQVAEPEKAVLDALDEPAHAGGMAEVVEAIGLGVQDEVFQPDRLMTLASQYPNQAVVARLGYLLERFGAPYAAHLKAWVRRRGSVPLLSPAHGAHQAVYVPDWRLRVNLPDGLFPHEDVA